MTMLKSYTYIYGLQDPRDGKIYYVGKSDNPKVRLISHLRMTDSNRAKNNWLSDLKQGGISPNLVILEEVVIADWQEKERYWIDKYRSDNKLLTNISNGGGGCFSAFQPDWIKAIAYYLSTSELMIFRTLDDRTKIEICRAVAIKMLPYTKAQLYSIGRENDYVPGYEAQIGADFATELISNLGTDRYNDLIYSVSRS